MSFDGFLLAFESRDLSQADKSIYECLIFPKLLYQKNFLALGNLAKIDVLVNFIIRKVARLKSKIFPQFFSVFLIRGISERIESIHFAERSGLSW